MMYLDEKTAALVRATAEAIAPHEEELKEVMLRLRAVRKLAPEHKDRAVWDIITAYDMLPRDVFAIWRHLPDPLRRGRGRTRGSAALARDLAEIERLVAEGAEPRDAARTVAKQDPTRTRPQAIESRVDYLLKAEKNKQ
jgi:hypothetical protein